VTACPSPNAYTLALPRRMRCSPTVNVDRLKPYLAWAAELPPPGQSTDAGQEGEHEVELLLNRRTVRGVTRYLVRWRGHASADDEWLRLQELAHCPAKVAEYDAAAPRRRHAARRHAAAPAAASPVVPAPALLEAPTGFRLAVPAEVVTGQALVGRTVLFRWPTVTAARRGPGTVGRRSRAAGFSHVVRYGPRSALGAAVAASLLDAASHGPAGRWVLLCPTRPGPRRRFNGTATVMGLGPGGPGDAGRTDRDLSEWNDHTRLMHRNQLCLTTLILARRPGPAAGRAAREGSTRDLELTSDHCAQVPLSSGQGSFFRLLWRNPDVIGSHGHQLELESRLVHCHSFKPGLCCTFWGLPWFRRRLEDHGNVEGTRG
jgi:hypothetical protein